MSENEVIADNNVVNDDDLDAFAANLFGERKAADPAAKLEVEQDKVDDTDVGDTDSQKTDDADEDDELDAELPEKVETPKKRTFQDRIDELVKQREDEKRAGDAKLVELEKAFEAKLAALNPSKPVQKAAEPQPDTVNEDGTAKYALGEFDPLYIRDLTRYTLEAERSQAAIRDQEQRQVQEQESQKAALFNSWNEKLVPAKEKYPDLMEKGEVLLNGFNNLDRGYADYLTTILMSMDYGPDVLNYLANNQDEAVKIVNSGAQKATLALGRIEAKFAEAEQTKQLAKPKISKAPPPPSAVARGTGGGNQSVAADTDDLDAFESTFFRKRK